jgi:DNA-binding response OmpR family regulator
MSQRPTSSQPPEFGEHIDNTKRYTITLDDDPTVATIIAQATGLPSLPFKSSKALLSRASLYKPIAAYVDVHLDIDDVGLHLIPSLRSVWPDAALFVITADPDPELIATALALGANDFIRKPMIPTEIRARLQTRVQELDSSKRWTKLTLGPLSFVKEERSLQCGEKMLQLPRLESKLLLLLLSHREMTIGKDELKLRMWGKVNVADNTLDKKISKLREALTLIGAPVAIDVAYGKGVRLCFKNDSEGGSPT